MSSISRVIQVLKFCMDLDQDTLSNKNRSMMLTIGSTIYTCWENISRINFMEDLSKNRQKILILVEKVMSSNGLKKIVV